MVLNYFKVNGDAINDPTFATEGSAAFDLRADLSRTKISGYLADGEKIETSVYLDDSGNRCVYFSSDPAIRWMVPSGLIFDIPDGYHIKLFMRGGTGLKRGLRLANGTGIVDSDFVQETHLLLQNLSGTPITLEHNERLCQGMLEKNVEVNLTRVDTPPSLKTSRVSGYNSTGRF
jgi:dUTP pyrophosphatase